MCRRCPPDAARPAAIFRGGGSGRASSCAPRPLPLCWGPHPCTCDAGARWTWLGGARARLGTHAFILSSAMPSASTCACSPVCSLLLATSSARNAASRADADASAACRPASAACIVRSAHAAAAPRSLLCGTPCTRPAAGRPRPEACAPAPPPAWRSIPCPPASGARQQPTGGGGQAGRPAYPRPGRRVGSRHGLRRLLAAPQLICAPR